MMNTNTAKKLAEYRQAVMEGFLDEFMAEWEGMHMNKYKIESKY